MAVSSVESVDWEQYDFIDMGAGTGGSLRMAETRIGGRGIGVERNHSKVLEARADGLEVVEGDIFGIPDKVRVRYVLFDNVLEHLPDLSYVARAISLAVSVAAEFIYIRHPSFEDEAYLAKLGLKQYWNDWGGHPAHILLTDFMELFSEVGVPSYMFYPVGRATDSGDPMFLPLGAPPDQHEFKEDLHGPKPLVAFDRPVYRAFDIVALTTPGRIELSYPSDPEATLTRPYVRVWSEPDLLNDLRYQRDQAVQLLTRIRERKSVKWALRAVEVVKPLIHGYRRLQSRIGSVKGD